MRYPSRRRPSKPPYPPRPPSRPTKLVPVPPFPPISASSHGGMGVSDRPKGPVLHHLAESQHTAHITCMQCVRPSQLLVDEKARRGTSMGGPSSVTTKREFIRERHFQLSYAKKEDTTTDQRDCSETLFMAHHDQARLSSSHHPPTTRPNPKSNRMESTLAQAAAFKAS